MRKTTSLTARLTIAYTVSSLTLVVGATLYLYWSFVKALDLRDENFFSSKVESIRSLLAQEDDGRALQFRIEKEWSALTSQIFYVRVLGPSGRVISQSPNGINIFKNQAFPPDGSQPVLNRLGGMVFRSFSASFQNGGRSYRVQIVLDRTEESALIAAYRVRLLIVLAICFVGCAFVCFQIAHRGLRPLRNMAEAAKRITSSNLHEKMRPNDLPRELDHLAETFDDMLDRLKDSFERLQRFSADIAHELRTPINNISGELQVALGKDRPIEFYKEAIGSCLEECARLSRIIDSLLFLARSENPEVAIAKERINLRRELAGTLEFYEPAASEKGIHCSLDVADDLDIQAERTLFQRAVGNVLSNAIKMTAAPGEISLSAKEIEGEVQIEIRDTGPGIPKEHLPRLFDRFYRVDASRSSDSGGSGLGLAIVKSIASTHGGSVSISSQSGVGTHVRLSFPSSHITNS